MLQQKSLIKPIHFSGVGLHSGHQATVTLLPVAANSGIVFHRTDVNQKIPCSPKHITNTNRSTTITYNNISIITIEHLLSALYSLEIDNVIIEVDNDEIPILDGSTKPIIDKINEVGTIELNVPKKEFVIKNYIEWKDDATDAEYMFMPHHEFSVTCLIDYPSKLIHNQFAVLNNLDEYYKEIAPAKTFCFLHEIDFLYNNGLIRGGNINNALIYSEIPLDKNKIKWIADTFNQPINSIPEKGILNPLYQSFDNEAARHKILDVIGDLALTQTYWRGKLICYKPGHASNVRFSNFLYEKIISKHLITA